VKTIRIILAIGLMAVGLIGYTATAGSAHTGSVYGQETCDGWSASVSLNNNVTADRTVTITSTIPGTPASTVLHQNTTGNNGPVVVWDHSGDENDISGTVTLTITPDAFSDSASISPAEGCVPPKPEPKVVETSSEKLDCATKLVTTETVTTTTDWVLKDNEWVEAVPVSVTTTTTRDATIEECPASVPPKVAPPAPPVVAPPVPVVPVATPAAPQLAFTGAGETTGLALIGSLLVGGGFLMSRRNKAKRGLNV
jgi:hypothetical protein